MEIYSDQSIAYNSEGFARLYGWWNDEEDEDDDLPRTKKDKEKGVEESDLQPDGWNEKN